MTIEQLAELFEKHQDEEYLDFGRVSPQLSTRPDLHAFMRLDQEMAHEPDDHDMICGAEHDRFFLSVSSERLAAVATEALVIELLRCGVAYDKRYDSLYMNT